MRCLYSRGAALSRHTPTPWQVGQAGNANIVHFDGDDVRPVAHAEANNVAFIVRACNSHDELLEALSAVTESLADTRDVELGNDPDGWEAVKKGRAAIAKATVQ